MTIVNIVNPLLIPYLILWMKLFAQFPCSNCAINPKTQNLIKKIQFSENYLVRAKRPSENVKTHIQHYKQPYSND